MSSPRTFDVTGVQRTPDGKVRLVEVECRALGGRIAFAQASLPGIAGTVAALVVDQAPLVVVVGGEDGGCLMLDGRLPPHPLPQGRDLAGDELDEARVVAAVAHLFPLFADGLYSVTWERAPPPVVPGISFVRTTDARPRRVVDPGSLAPDEGEPIVADLGGPFAVLLGGRGALLSGQGTFVISAGFVLEAAGFEARAHDRGAREAFARSPRALLDDGALRDAWAAHRRRHPDATLGPLTEDKLEPAAQVARAVVWDLRAEEGVDSASELVRERVGRATELRVQVALAGASWDVALVSHDGRHLQEAVVRQGQRFRATGVKPSGRAIARVLRALAAEGDA